MQYNWTSSPIANKRSSASSQNSFQFWLKKNQYIADLWIEIYGFQYWQKKKIWIGKNKLASSKMRKLYIGLNAQIRNYDLLTLLTRVKSRDASASKKWKSIHCWSVNWEIKINSMLMFHVWLGFKVWERTSTWTLSNTIAVLMFSTNAK